MHRPPGQGEPSPGDASVPPVVHLGHGFPWETHPRPPGRGDGHDVPPPVPGKRRGHRRDGDGFGEGAPVRPPPFGRYLAFDAAERPVGAQLFGSDPGEIEEGGRRGGAPRVRFRGPQHGVPRPEGDRRRFRLRDPLESAPRGEDRPGGDPRRPGSRSRRRSGRASATGRKRTSRWRAELFDAGVGRRHAPSAPPGTDVLRDGGLGAHRGAEESVPGPGRHRERGRAPAGGRRPDDRGNGMRQRDGRARRHGKPVDLRRPERGDRRSRRPRRTPPRPFPRPTRAAPSSCGTATRCSCSTGRGG